MTVKGQGEVGEGTGKSVSHCSVTVLASHVTCWSAVAACLDRHAV